MPLTSPARHHVEHVHPHPRPATLSPEDRLRLMGDIGRTLNALTDPQELFERVTELITHFFDYYYSIVMIRQGDELVVRSAHVREHGEYSEMLGRRYRIGEHGITGWCAQEARTIVVPDVNREPRFVTHRGTERVKSAVAVPLLGRDRLIGVLDAESDRPDDFHEDDVVLLETLATQLAVVIENANLFHAERQRARRLATVTEIARKVTSILDLQELLDQTTALIAERFDYYSTSILLRDPDDDRWLVWASGNPGARHAPSGWRQRADEGLAGWAVETGRTQFANDTLSDPHFIQAPGLRTRSEIDVPLKIGGRVVGVLGIGSEQPNAFTEDEIPFIETLADQIAVAIENARLVERARELARSEERNRLAREIHDTLAQTLTAIALELDSVQRVADQDRGWAAGAIEHARNLAHQALEEARHAIWSLRPVSLDRLSLGEALAQEVSSLERSGGVEEARFSIRGEPRQLPPEVEAALFRIAQEALSNVRKHASARRVREVLSFEEDSIRLVVEDDGVGFEPGARRSVPDGGIGLSSMRQRASLIGATLEIDGRPGWGTRVEARVPARPASRAEEAQAAIRVFLVDDHALVREGIRAMLEAMPGIALVGTAETGEDASNRVRDLATRVVLMDVRLPGMDGIEATRRIHETAPTTRVLMLSTAAPDELVLEAVRAGASGYVLKDISPEDLREAIQTVARGGSYFSPAVAAKLAGGVHRGGSIVERLTARELAVLRHLATGASNKQIAFNLHISENTVQSHLRRVYGKLDVRSRTEALRRAAEWGVLEI